MQGHAVRRSDIRNIAIIAHVDHGKTTLVDRLLQQTGTFRSNERLVERVMDSSDLERERGITILAKNTSIHYQGVKINIVDTPGHADFGGEVERILGMVDGVLLLVDAAEGPLPQTRFVLKKSLELGLRPIVVINKVDRTDARPHAVLDEVFQLMLDLGAADEQLDFPHLYASGKLGYARRELERTDQDVRPLLDTILASVPCPPGDARAPLQLQISNLDYNDYVGRMAIGRISRGTIRIGSPIALLKLNGAVETHKVTRLESFEGLKRTDIEEAAAGEIVALAGIPEIQIGETVADPDHLEALPPIRIDEPTLSMEFLVNDSPFAGQDGRFVTSRHLRERLLREARANVALRVEGTDAPDTLSVSGRGELHLAIVAETMRREGYEFQVSRPRIIPREGPSGEQLEPYEELLIDCPEGSLGVVMEKLGPRRATLLDMRNPGVGTVRMRFKIPARGLLGYRSEFLTDTRGTGIMHHRFLDYSAWAGPLAGRSRGVMVADREGVAVAYALFNLQERGTMFVKPGDAVYEGMLVGEHVRPGDMDVNATKEKKLTNMRTTAADEMIILEPPRQVTLELALEYIEDDELIEVTPASLRLRKRTLGATERRKQARSDKRAAADES